MKYGAPFRLSAMLSTLGNEYESLTMTALSFLKSLNIPILQPGFKTRATGCDAHGLVDC